MKKTASKESIAPCHGRIANAVPCWVTNNGLKVKFVVSVFLTSFGFVSLKQVRLCCLLVPSCLTVCNLKVSLNSNLYLV